jgi:hypothetical protein
VVGEEVSAYQTLVFLIRRTKRALKWVDLHKWENLFKWEIVFKWENLFKWEIVFKWEADLMLQMSSKTKYFFIFWDDTNKSIYIC